MRIAAIQSHLERIVQCGNCAQSSSIIRELRPDSPCSVRWERRSNSLHSARLEKIFYQHQEGEDTGVTHQHEEDWSSDSPYSTMVDGKVGSRKNTV